MLYCRDPAIQNGDEGTVHSANGPSTPQVNGGVRPGDADDKATGRLCSKSGLASLTQDRPHSTVDEHQQEEAAGPRDHHSVAKGKNH